MINYSKDGWHISIMPNEGGIFHKWKTIAIPVEVNVNENANGAERRWPCGLVLRVSFDNIKAHKPAPMYRSTGRQANALFHHVPVNKFYLHAGDPTWLRNKGYELKNLTAPLGA